MRPLPGWRSAAFAAAVPGARHLFTGRAGGASVGPFDSANLGQHVGDDPQAVAQNRRRALTTLGAPLARWCGLRQVHGTALHAFASQRRSQAVPEGDGAWTREPHLALAVLSADCLPILLAAREGRAVAALHAGWRGLAAGIISQALRQMQAEGLQPQNWQVVLGPAIGPCCFTIAAAVAQALRALGPAAAAAVQPRGNAFCADLWQLAAACLQQAGTPASQVHALRQCSRCSSACFSYRRTQPQPTGRQAGLILLAA